MEKRCLTLCHWQQTAQMTHNSGHYRYAIMVHGARSIKVEDIIIKSIVLQNQHYYSFTASGQVVSSPFSNLKIKYGATDDEIPLINSDKLHNCHLLLPEHHALTLDNFCNKQKITHRRKEAWYVEEVSIAWCWPINSHSFSHDIYWLEWMAEGR